MCQVKLTLELGNDLLKVKKKKGRNDKGVVFKTPKAKLNKKLLHIKGNY